MSFGDLILILTHRCTKQCPHCFIAQDSSQMPLLIAKKAISFFLKKSKSTRPLKIKFFGGEPLLRFRLIQSLFKSFRSGFLKKEMSFELTTNGDLLDSKALSFFNEQRRFDLWLSFYFDNHQKFEKKLKSLSDVGINMTISPSASGDLFGAFRHLSDLGYNKFNFLPCYFLLWSNKDIRVLRNQFDKICSYIKCSKTRDTPFQIKNAQVLSPTFLFNNGFVVDCNGDVFLNNLILTRLFSNLRQETCIGNIQRPEAIRWDQYFDFQQIIRSHTDPDIYFSSMAVDRVLSDFVRSLN